MAKLSPERPLASLTFRTQWLKGGSGQFAPQKGRRRQVEGKKEKKPRQTAAGKRGHSHGWPQST